MQVPLQITVRDMPHSEALETYIREKVQKLDADSIRAEALKQLAEDAEPQ